MIDEGKFKLYLAEKFAEGAWKSNYAPFKNVTTGVVGNDRYVVSFNWIKYGSKEALFSLPKAPAERQEKIKLYEKWVEEFRSKMPHSPIRNPLQ